MNLLVRLQMVGRGKDVGRVVARRENEWMVITRSKELCSYVFTVTEKSPKKFRFTLVGRMQNLVLDVTENNYKANDVYISKARLIYDDVACRKGKGWTIWDSTST